MDDATMAAATFTRKTAPFHKIPNATPIGLFPTATFVKKKGVFCPNNVFEHTHKDNPISKIFRINIPFSQITLDLQKNLQG